MWEICRENIVVYYDKKLGSGAFGDVYAGRLIGDAAIKNVYKDSAFLNKFRDCDIAVKSLPPFADDWSKGDFQKVNL